MKLLKKILLTLAVAYVLSCVFFMLTVTKADDLIVTIWYFVPLLIALIVGIIFAIIMLLKQIWQEES